MSAHTPGPWEVGPTGHVIRTVEREDADGRHHPRKTLVRLESMDPASMSNAHLIAAAPDLLEAAHKALAEHEDAGCSCGGCAELRAAVAKAEGKS